MAGLARAIHVLVANDISKTWLPGTSLHSGARQRSPGGRA